MRPLDAATLPREIVRWTELSLSFDPSLKPVAWDCSEGTSSFEFKRIGRALRCLVYPDWRVWSANIEQYVESGASIGVRGALPRGPAVFERKRKW